MIQMIYASAAAQPFPPESLRVLLSKARVRNALYGVSGMLLYHSGSFLQVVEGPEEHVDRIIDSVFRDPRHVNTRTLSRQSIASREFEAWSMGFVDTTLVLTQPTGHVDYHRALPSLTDTGTRARQFLRFFQEGLYRQYSV